MSIGYKSWTGQVSLNTLQNSIQPHSAFERCNAATCNVKKKKEKRKKKKKEDSHSSLIYTLTRNGDFL